MWKILQGTQKLKKCLFRSIVRAHFMLMLKCHGTPINCFVNLEVDIGDLATEQA